MNVMAKNTSNKSEAVLCMIVIFYELIELIG
jgi:hypothetical protein